MRPKARNSEPELRGEIEYLLEHKEPDFERGEQVGTAWTAEAIADELAEPVKDVKRALRELHEEGKVIIRRLRSGHILWKLPDVNHDRWQAFAGPGAKLGLRVALQRF